MKSCRQRFHQTGFSLVEIMVGLAIGMFTMLVIMQVISVFEKQKRATTGTADALTNGGIALYNMSRELQMAGFPLMPDTNSALECANLTYGATGRTGISPVVITDGGGASDTVTIRYGDTSMGGLSAQILGIVGNAMTVSNNFGCNVGDIALVINGTTCALSSATAVAGSTTPMTVTLNNTTATAIGANIACLGNWNEITYRVNAGNLERNGVPVVAGIVNLQAQYGISATGLANTSALFNQVTQWVDATGATWAAPTVANRNRIKSIRISVVARNQKIESGVVTAACSSTTAAAPTGMCAWIGNISSPAPTIDLSNDPAWARYSYRVYETIIPLRNVIWAKDTL